MGLTLAGEKSRWVLFGVNSRRVFNEGSVQPYFTWKSLPTPGLSVFFFYPHLTEMEAVSPASCQFPAPPLAYFLPSSFPVSGGSGQHRSFVGQSWELGGSESRQVCGLK